MSEQLTTNYIIFEQINAGKIAWSALLESLVSSGNVDLVKLQENLLIAHEQFVDMRQTRAAKWLSPYLEKVQKLSDYDQRSHSE